MTISVAKVEPEVHYNMTRSQLDARTFGIGELITQRKNFYVPAHQRSYAWSAEQVEQFLTDIEQALKTEVPDYFVGLVVLQGPSSASWEILDGQQRLATTTMVYSAIRNWLSERNFDDDAKQIEGEFIGVRQLGEVNFTPRLRMNLDNRPLFDTYVVRKAPIDSIKKAVSSLRKGSSNANLLDAALTCRAWIEHYAGKDETFGADALFRLASFLEVGVKVVCVDVATGADAYTLFEVLNDRGADLSALDLVKNHIFSNAYSGEIPQLEERWQQLASAVDDGKADDFLKVFWTSRYGVIQKNTIYRRVKDKFPSRLETEQLLSDLCDTAAKLRAIDDPSDTLWAEYPAPVRENLCQVISIGGRQVRPLLLSAIYRFTKDDLTTFMRMVVVLLVRYQLIGRGRTGILEKAVGRLSEQVWGGAIGTSKEAWQSLKEIVPDDRPFAEAFAKHAESKRSRIRYLLAALNSQLMHPVDQQLRDASINEIIRGDDVLVQAPISIGDELLVTDFALLERWAYELWLGTPVNPPSLTGSKYPLTTRLGNDSDERDALPSHQAAETIRQYVSDVSSLAVKTWPISF